jgi:hypothetical protein
MRVAGSALAIAAVLLPSPRAEARPQNSVQGQLGVVSGSDAPMRLNLGLKVESLWFREGPKDFGIGPFVEGRNGSFAYGELGGGLVALLPVHELLPLWVGAGGFARREDARWGSGFHGFVAWGVRPYNFHGNYGLTAGLMADARVHQGQERGFELVVSSTLDLQALSYPVMYLIGALRH